MKTMIERSAPAGAMPPLVRRGESETYRVVQGELTFFVDGDVVHAAPGDVVHAPAGAARTFRADSDDARWLVSTHVSSLQRFIDFGRAVAMAGSEWTSPEEKASVGSMGAANGIELLGPPGALPARS
jgi:gentisate 1,2-dioxygenase